MLIHRGLAIALALIGLVRPTLAEEITGAGSTFAPPIVTKWSAGMVPGLASQCRTSPSGQAAVSRRSRRKASISAYRTRR
jgi:hypothetical protein